MKKEELDKLRVALLDAQEIVAIAELEYGAALEEAGWEYDRLPLMDEEFDDICEELGL